jgi:cbb3-type cytochrome oxidase subunit 3
MQSRNPTRLTDMRDLIRPTLFILARLGLFLAVVAWIVGQWWQVTCALPVSSDGVAVWICARGWVLEYGEFASESELRFDFRPEYGQLDGLVFGEEFKFSENAFGNKALAEVADSRSVNVAGVVFGQSWGITDLAIRHWLIVTFFALFYGVLKWVYRKRGNELAADE